MSDKMSYNNKQLLAF